MEKKESFAILPHIFKFKNIEEEKHKFDFIAINICKFQDEKTVIDEFLFNNSEYNILIDNCGLWISEKYSGKIYRKLRRFLRRKKREGNVEAEKIEIFKIKNKNHSFYLNESKMYVDLKSIFKNIKNNNIDGLSKMKFNEIFDIIDELNE